ncbi:NUDIX hydrolase [Candidatus Symbiopectobacterium sp. NZEC135]|uniref:NUDIX hydrolase n=1 Tax=Candidatus Symbiopectobacterium sp. NZEC135 TaxID=2820471 RepID=UPI0022279098|nr:NUDIX domain-containing protein [Candidatus Symbiopectobacterium sp. NZEC135]MCW2478328.1 NUDIX domain-containing protein [Candidatus Symbiopectobacterium sp. NZEC135]
METSRVIRIAAAVITDATGACLLVRKQGTTAFMQPGGKMEPGETPEQALVRELKEELSIQIALSDLTYLGHFSDQAVNEPGYVVEADVYRVQGVTSVVTPAAEIAEIAWVNPTAPTTLRLAPLTQQQLLPLAAAF